MESDVIAKNVNERYSSGCYKWRRNVLSDGL